ncbi:MAG: hypothetical protein ABL998_03495, partial [Planctomycetota bacterium]
SSADDAATLDLDADGWLDLAYGQAAGGARIGGEVQVVLGQSDADGDGHATGGFWSAGADCDDGDPDRIFGAEEIDGDGLDADCDGADDAPESTHTRVCPTFTTLAEARALADDPGGAFGGVDEAAHVKASFLNDVATGHLACPLVSRARATPVPR